MDYLEMRTEHILRARQSNDDNYIPRAEIFIDQAVRDVARCYRHYPLETTAPGALEIDPAGPQPTVYAIPEDCQTLIGVELTAKSPASGETFIGAMEATPSFQAHLRTRKITDGGRAPTSYSRFGQNIVLETFPDQIYETLFYYYKFPLPPDYVTPSSPEIEEVWHPHIIEYSLVIAGNAVGESEVTQQALASLQVFLAMMPDPQFSAMRFPQTHQTELDDQGGV